MKLRYAVIHLEGDAIQWHRAFMKTRGATVAELTWENYMRAISSRFSNAMFEDPVEEIASLVQDNDLHEYNNAFDALLNKVTLSETQAVSLYLKGLKPKIRGPVKMFKPSTLHEAYGLAKIQNLNNTTLENKLTLAKGGATHPKNTNETGRVTPPVNASKFPLLPNPNTRPIGATTTKIGAKVSRRLTSKELELKRAKGECFWCTVKDIPSLNVSVAGGKQLQCNQICHDFQ
ncbi:putative nucleotidyltransferase, ribonuclease H, partial [Tanacetum coccineum]